MFNLFGNPTAERALLYLQNYGEGHARAIASTFDLTLSAVQRQLIKFEQNGVLVSQMKGRTRLFTWNPRYPLRAELTALLERALSLLPKSAHRRWFLKRSRPRRVGKPL